MKKMINGLVTALQSLLSLVFLVSASVLCRLGDGPSLAVFGAGVAVFPVPAAPTDMSALAFALVPEPLLPPDAPFKADASVTNCSADI